MGKIAEVFGKETDLRPNDVQRIVDQGLEESPTLEYKTLEGVTQLGDVNKEGLLIRPLVAFLNRPERQSSLLVLGIKTDRVTGHRPERVVPIDRAILDEEKIRHAITNSINSIPQLVSFPSVRIVSVSFPDDRFVHLVEITRDESAFYYSSITGLSYVRRANDSQQLSMQEVYVMTQSKRVAKLKFLPMKLASGRLPSGRTQIEFDAVVNNGGLIPGTDVALFLHFDVEGRANRSNVTISTTGNLREVSEYNPDYLKSFTFDDEATIYPDFNLVIGKVKLEFPLGTKLTLQSKIFDTDGTSTQSFKINTRDRIKPIRGPEFRIYGA